MPFDFTFSLSLAAVDLLWEQLRLGPPVRIFEIPSVGATAEDRDRLLQVVLDDLTSRNLAHRGRLTAEVEEALVALGRFRHAIEIVGLSEDGDKLLAKVAEDGRTAVRAKLLGQTIAFDTFRPDGLVREAVALIGAERPGPGRSVTFPEVQERPAPVRQPDAGGFPGVFEPVRADSSGYDLERRAAQTMWERPRKRIGMFTAYGRDARGHEVMTPVLSWFDTDEGRYFGHSRPGADGQQWTTYSPSDEPRITQQLVDMLASADRPVAGPR
jgi:EspG family